MAQQLDPVKLAFGGLALWLVGYEMLYNGLAKHDCSSIGGQIDGGLARLMRVNYACATSTAPASTTPTTGATKVNTNSPTSPGKFGDANNFVGPTTVNGNTYYLVEVNGHQVASGADGPNGTYSDLTAAENAYNANGGPAPG